MNRRAIPPLRKLATLGIVALGLALAGCGLKGSLDPPPSPTPPQQQVEGQPAPPATPGAPNETPPPARKSFFLDWLLD